MYISVHIYIERERERERDCPSKLGSGISQARIPQRAPTVISFWHMMQMSAASIDV